MIKKFENVAVQEVKQNEIIDLLNSKIEIDEKGLFLLLFKAKKINGTKIEIGIKINDKFYLSKKLREEEQNLKSISFYKIIKVKENEKITIKLFNVGNEDCKIKNAILTIHKID